MLNSDQKLEKSIAELLLKDSATCEWFHRTVILSKMSSTLKRPFSKTWGTASNNGNQIILFIVAGWFIIYFSFATKKGSSRNN